MYHDLAGTWAFPTVVESGTPPPGEEETFFHITPTGRYVSVIPNPSPGQPPLVMRLWFSYDTGMRYLIVGHPAQPPFGAVDIYFQGEMLVIDRGESTFRCRRVAEEDVPAAFREELTRSHAQMDDIERGAPDTDT